MKTFEWDVWYEKQPKYVQEGLIAREKGLVSALKGERIEHKKERKIRIAVDKEVRNLTRKLENVREQRREKSDCVKGEYIQNLLGSGNLIELYPVDDEGDELCAICLYVERVENKSLSMDHDHKTGRNRGQLCMDCNTGLGKFFDRPDLLIRAATYVSEALTRDYVSTIVNAGKLAQ